MPIFPFFFLSPFDFGRWRWDNQYRRSVVVYAVVTALQAGPSSVEDAVRWMKDFMGYDDRPKEDQAIIQQFGTYVRKIALHWDRLDEDTQEAFLRGDIPPSRLNNLIREDLQHRV